MLGYFLVIVIIILGGAIATLGDRIGSKVGKARLSLFNLRPKNTAIVITILTGAVISALTLGIVFAFSQQFRDALFRFDDIQKRSRIVQKELDETQAEKDAIEADLTTARSSLSRTRQRLKTANRNLVKAIAREKRIERQLKQTQSRFRQSKRQINQFVGQAKQLRSQIQSLRTEQNTLRVQRNQSEARIQQVNRQKRQLETAIAQAQSRLRQVEVQKQALTLTIAAERQQLQAANQQRQQLQQEVQTLEAGRARLEQNVEFLLLGLRRGTIAIRSGQILTSAVIQDIQSRTDALKAINTLLIQARQSAITLSDLQGVPDQQQIVQMRQSDVERIAIRIGDGKPYVVRILAAASYLQGERAIFVVPQIATNRVIYQADTQIARISVQPAQMSDEQLLDRINQLFAVVNKKAIVAGFLPNPLTGTVGSGRQVDLFRFILALKDRNDPGTIEIIATTPETVLTAGPLAIELVAVKDQDIILKSGDDSSSP
ncbi:DUF3084 domain-containing protein [Acaryochloris sp. IP29b_bin.148]|uniref:DUF3084 domain-containing protein n=1 Tax=Acaryochloris sp. IP29b_bin.148 TaxID=2969218 RepID=UPI00263076EB|nr:DUF3084 domain-containing protein [Acaryochloris sp. IP29b_bin.148]